MRTMMAEGAETPRTQHEFQLSFTPGFLFYHIEISDIRLVPDLQLMDVNIRILLSLCCKLFPFF
jgi:hypothetical protein